MHEQTCELSHLWQIMFLIGPKSKSTEKVVCLIAELEICVDLESLDRQNQKVYNRASCLACCVSSHSNFDIIRSSEFRLLLTKSGLTRAELAMISIHQTYCELVVERAKVPMSGHPTVSLVSRRPPEALRTICRSFCRLSVPRLDPRMALPEILFTSIMSAGSCTF